MANRVLTYELYPIAWDNLAAMTAHLPTLSQLGVDYVWCAPLYPSPRVDHGYDIADYCAIDRRFGTLADFDDFVATAHSHSLKVLMDLVLNHTSIDHPWFHAHPEYYCWRRENPPKWGNYFDGGPAWEKCGERGYYLHSFAKGQPDLNWFPYGKLNTELVLEFRKIVRFWMDRGVDGFRLDVPQSINKNFSAKSLNFEDCLYGQKAITVLNAVFPSDGARLSSKKPFLIMEMFDPTFGDLMNVYVKDTPIDYALNISIKNTPPEKLRETVKEATDRIHLMLDLESHDSPRAPSRFGLSPDEVLQLMFGSDPAAVCLYQGQELYLQNPDQDELPDLAMISLDAETRMRFQRGENLDDLRPLSRANARVHYPTATRDAELADPNSFFHQMRNAILRWKTR